MIKKLCFYPGILILGFILTVSLKSTAVELSDLSVKDLVVISVGMDVADPNQQLLDYFGDIADAAFAQRRSELDAVQDAAGFDLYREKMRNIYTECVGPFPEKSPLNVKYYGTVDCGDYDLSRITYESLPGYLVTANLYVPKTHSVPYPLMLCTTGHWWGGKGQIDGKGATHMQQRCSMLARLGYIVLAFDPFGQGERKILFNPDSEMESDMGQATHQHIALNLQLHLTGHNMTNYFIWDCIRGIDVLCGLDNADTSRIAVTGASGGGSQTQYVAGADPRITAVIPVCANWHYGTVPHSGKGNLDGEQNIPGRIRYGFELSDLLMMNNVKDMMLINATGDKDILNTSVDMYNEINGVFTRVYGDDRDRTVAYHLIGAPHNYNRESRETMYHWLNQKFDKLDETNVEIPVEVRGAKDINVTQSGSVEELGSESLLTLNEKYVREIAPSFAEIKSRSDIDALRESVSDKIKTVLKLDAIPSNVESRIVNTSSGDDFKLERILLHSDRGLWMPGILLTPDSFDRETGRTVVYVHERGKANGIETIKQIAQSGCRVFAMDLRGYNEFADPHPEQKNRDDGPVFKGYQIIYGREDNEADFNAFAYEMQKPLFGMRLHDLMSGIAYLESRPDMQGKSLDIYGYGDGAMLALHAAVLDENIENIVLDHMVSSFKELAVKPYGAASPFLFIHNVLAYYDTPQLLASLAPRHVVLTHMVNAKREIDTTLDKSELKYIKTAWNAAGNKKNLTIKDLSSTMILQELLNN